MKSRNYLTVYNVFEGALFGYFANNIIHDVDTLWSMIFAAGIGIALLAVNWKDITK